MKREYVICIRPQMAPFIASSAEGTIHLRFLQDMVDGHVECVHPFPDHPDILLCVNEEGKINNLPLNRMAVSEDGELLDVFFGTILLAKVELGGNIKGLSDKEIAWACKLFEPKTTVLIRGI